MNCTHWPTVTVSISAALCRSWASKWFDCSAATQTKNTPVPNERVSVVVARPLGTNPMRQMNACCGRAIPASTCECSVGRDGGMGRGPARAAKLRQESAARGTSKVRNTAFLPRFNNWSLCYRISGAG